MKLDKSQDWQAMGLPSDAGQNVMSAFFAPRQAAPIKQNPRAHLNVTRKSKRAVERTAKLLAFRPGASHNYAPVPTPSKIISRAQGAMRTA